MPFLWEPSPPADCYEMNCPAKFPCSAASLLCPFRVARVSRLIGNSDTTANCCGWQANSVAYRIRPVGRHPKLASKVPQTQETPLQTEWRSAVLRWSLASQMICGRWLFPPCLLADFPGRFSLLRAASLAVALAGCLLFFGLAELFQQPVHHWHSIYIAIADATLCISLSFNDLQDIINARIISIYGTFTSEKSPKNHRSRTLPLAVRTVMRPPSSQHNAPDRRLAAAAGKARAQVDAVFQLEEAAHAVGVHIIADRRAAQPDGVLREPRAGPAAAVPVPPWSAGQHCRRGRMPARNRLSSA